MKKLLIKYFLWLIISTIPIFYSYTSFLEYKEVQEEYETDRIIFNAMMQRVVDRDETASSFEKERMVNDVVGSTNKLRGTEKDYSKRKIHLIWSAIFILIYFSIFIHVNFLKQRKSQ